MNDNNAATAIYETHGQAEQGLPLGGRCRHYDTGDRMKHWGKIGPLAVAGPIVSWIVAGLEGAAVVGGLGALGAALFAIGIPKDSVLKYEAATKADKFLVLVHGTGENARRAKQILDKAGPAAAAVHLG